MIHRYQIHIRCIDPLHLGHSNPLAYTLRLITTALVLSSGVGKIMTSFLEPGLRKKPLE